MIPPLDMIQQYAPDVAPQTIVAIIQVESGGNQYGIGINGPVRTHTRPKSAKEAAAEARRWISRGYSVDVGLMQINSRNLQRLGITIEQAFDPAINIQVGAKILVGNYRQAIKFYGPGQNALKAALSAYNTGNYVNGFKNGYVAKYYSRCALRRTCGNDIHEVKEPFLPKNFDPEARNTVSKNNFPYRTPVFNPYAAELTIYLVDKLSKIPSSQYSAQLQAPDAIPTITDSQILTDSD
jgi:type IV secretion system protein VirB1